MDCEFRLSLLAESGQVDADSLVATRRVIRAIEEKYSLVVNEENGGMLVTHLAVALARLKAGQPVTDIPGAALDEAREFAAEWQFVRDIAGAAAASLGATLPESEIAFMTLHLATLLQSGGSNG